MKETERRANSKQPRHQLPEMPDGYSLFKTVDLQHDKKTALLLNLSALAIAAVMAGIALWIRGLDIEAVFYVGPAQAAAAVVLLLLYMVLHELTHGIFMRLFSGIRPYYGYTGLYAFAAVDAVFPKSRYIIIGLAPVVILGAVLAVLNAVLPEYFWIIYLIQIINISGAAGDLYITWLLSHMPDDILIFDTGTAMQVYSK